MDTEITRLAIDAIKKTKAQLDEKYAGQTLFGYALCTDDDVSGVFHAACTEEWVATKSKEYDDIGYVSVDWEQSGDDSLFDPVNELVRKEYDRSSDDFCTRRDERFEELLQALVVCRADGIFDDRTHLSLGSTDPCDHLELLEMRGIDRINPKEKADELAEALGFEKYRKNK